MKKIVTLLIMLLLLMSNTSNVFSSGQKGITYPLTLSNLEAMNFRKEPNTSSEIIGTVSMFTAFSIEEETSDFFKTTAICTDGIERNGYLSKIYAKKAEKISTLSLIDDLAFFDTPGGANKGVIKKDKTGSLDIYYEINGYMFFIEQDDYGFVSRQTATRTVLGKIHEHDMTEILDSSLIFNTGYSIAMNKGTRSKIDAPALIHDGRSMIPVRYAAEWFGGTLSWDDIEKCVCIATDDKEIKFFTGRNEMIVNDEKIPLEVAPIIVNDRSFVPLRAFSEAVDKQAYYNNERKQIIISDYKMSDDTSAEFCDYVNKNFNLYSDMKIEGMKISPIIPMGKAYSLTGNITSDHIISDVSIIIYDSIKGQEIKKSVTNNSKSFSMSIIDNDIKFSALTNGSKHIEVWATDQTHKRLLLDAKFTIMDIKNKFWWPVPSSVDFSGCYGRDGTRWHPAIDIPGANGVDVVASAGGIVIEIYNDATDNFAKGTVTGSGYGNYVKLEHTNKINGKVTVTKYNHLAKATAKVGDKLEMGDKLGELGSTGRSFGFHLDYQVFLDGEVTDPGPFIVIPPDIKFAGTTTECCLLYIENLKAMNNLN